VGEEEFGGDLAAFRDWLEKRRPAGLAWTFDPEPGENHGSLAMMTLYDGLRAIFADWATLPEAVALRGGDAIRAHQKGLADRFGYEIGMSRLAAFRLRVKWTEERNFEALIGLCRFGCQERPEDYFSHFSLAMALEQAGRWREAVPAYENALAAAGRLPADQRTAISQRLNARLAEARRKADGTEAGKKPQ